MAKHVIKKVVKSGKPAVFDITATDNLDEERLSGNPESNLGKETGSSQSLESNGRSGVSSDINSSKKPDSTLGNGLSPDHGKKYGSELGDGGEYGCGTGNIPGDEPGGGSGGGPGGGSVSGPFTSSGGGHGRKKSSNPFLIPIIILAVIAVLAWSWLLLLSPNFSKKAEPYVNKYFDQIVSVFSFNSGKTQAQDSSIAQESMGNTGVTTKKNNQSSNESSNSSEIIKENISSQETAKNNKKPSLDLQIYEGPTYSTKDQTCSYSVKAVVTGDPTPVVQFSRDDSKGTLGPNTALIRLKRNATSYTLTATARNEYGTAMDSLTINWGCNMPPVVSEIALSSDVVYVNKDYDLSITATDPDKDSLTYKWTVTGGTLSVDNAPTVKWTTPAAPENYQVKVDVKDSKGALTSKTISVYVGSDKAPETTAPPTTAPPTTAPPTTAPPTTAPPTTALQQSSLDVPKKSGEGGYVEYGGETFVGGNVYAGDSSSNKPCVGFISFDITPLAGKTITAARLTFTSSSVQGSPLSYCDSFWLNAADWGAGPIKQSDFNLPGIAIQSFTSPDITCNADKLKSEIQNAINSGKVRFQIRVHFAGPYTNNNSAKDGWEYAQQGIKLNVSYQ
ncbi:MAG TPA: hypothetical protein VF347_00165 [Candidatus Humimicrobiaceae bacterium]